MGYELADLGLLRDRLAGFDGLAVECGSGASTLIFCEAGVETVSLEHHPRWWRRTRRLLGDSGSVDLRLAELVETDDGWWYDTQLPDGIGFVLIDGPPVGYGRSATLPRIRPHLESGAEIWLDDWARPSEQETLAWWRDRFDIVWEPMTERLCRISC